MPPRLEFFYDYVSPFAYLANSQLPKLVERTGAEPVYRPVFLGGVMQGSGNSPPFTVPNKGRYVAADAARWARRYDVPLANNPHFPIQTLLPMRAALALLDDGGFPAYHEAIFRAVWCDGENVADAGVLTKILEKVGLDAARVLERCGEAAVKEALKANTAEAVERGAFGVPTFFVGDEMFFGNDRLDFVEEALRA